MKHIIRLFILIAALVLGTDHAWADTDSNPRVNFVYVEGDNYALNSGKGIAFASDADQTGQVTITVTINEGQDFRCIDGDLTAEQSINSNMGQARRRTSAEGPGNGVPVDVNCTKTNEFTLTLPEDESTNVTVYVRFSEKIRLIITADDLSVYWGSIAAPEFTVSCDGFQEGDDISKLEGTLTIDCDYSVDSEIGEKYAITPSGLTSADYAIHFRQGALTVKEVIVKVSVVDAINVKLDGAYVQVLDGEKRVDFWTSGGSAYKIDGLKAGKTYTLRETAAPEGYMIPSDITFTIDAEGKVATTGTTTTDEEGNTVLVLKNRRLLTHNNISVEAIDDQTWTGSAITPAVVVKDGEMDITDQCDISYSDNTDAGQATITITAKDGSDYAGSTTVHFLIYKTANTYYVDADGTRHDNIPAIVLSGYENSLNEGTYLVESDINVDHQIDLDGNVTIILGDGAEMNISNYPIYGGYSAMLTIYGQTQHGGEMKFSCNNSDIYCLYVCGGITINSGTVYVRTEYSDCQGIHTNGDLTINGGTIDINVTDAAIYAGGTVRINGGQVTAISTGNGNSSYGIYSANSDIILGYANASDFVNASSYRTDINKGYFARIKDGLMMRNHSDIYDKYNSMAAYNNGICQFNGIKLEPVPCTVTFDIEVEGNAPESQTVLYGFYAIEPTAPTREGYDFAGWKNGEDDYDFATPVAGDLTLTAKWEILRFEIDGIGITYEWTSETTVKVVGYNGASTSITILPSVEHNGVSYNVTEIGEGAFKDNNSLVSIELYPEAGHITIIGARAFKNCTNLFEIVLPVGLTTIEEETFSGSGLTEITIPASVESIGDYAFAGCSGLTEITIPASVESIGENAFEGCNENLIIYVPEDNVDFYRDLLPAYAAIILPESAKGAVPYIDADGKMAYCTDYTVLTGSETSLTGGWYVVNSDVSFDHSVTLTGPVNLILADGKTMNIGSNSDKISGYALNGGDHTTSALTVYGQSEGTGSLKVYATYTASEYSQSEGKGISLKGNYIQHGGNVTIDGTTTSNYGATGIAACNVAISGGVLTISSSLLSFCINATGTFTLSRGTVNVKKTNGSSVNINVKGDITVSGGILNATSTGGTVISGGSKIYLNGGTVTANNSASTGYGIKGNVTLSGSTLTTRSFDTWQNASSVTIADGLAYTDGMNVYTSATPSATLTALENVTLQPITGVTLTKDGSGNLTAEFDGTSLTTLSIPGDVTVNAINFGREFTEGVPVTLMLPFSLGEGQTFTGGTLYKFSGISKNSGTGNWEATMTESATLHANTPYLMMPNSSLSSSGKVTIGLNSNPVTLNTTTAGESSVTTDASDWEFKGSYEERHWYDGTDGVHAASNADEIGKVYGFAATSGKATDGVTDIAAGQFVRFASGAWIRPTRCYLIYNGTGTPGAGARNKRAAAGGELPDKITVRLIGLNGTTTAIGTLDTKTGELRFGDSWFSLDGTKLDGKPTKSGVYINNGKKIVVK